MKGNFETVQLKLVGLVDTLQKLVNAAILRLRGQANKTLCVTEHALQIHHSSKSIKFYLSKYLNCTSYN